MKKGFALITVLAVLLMISLGTAAILRSVSGHMNMKANHYQEFKAQYIAEAAAVYAAWRSRNGINTADENHIVTNETTGAALGTARILKEGPFGSGWYKIFVSVNYVDA